jgi:hypothetical protein
MKIIITESQYKKVIKSTIDEAVAYSVAKKYLEIKRSPEAEERIKQVFTNLKSLPNARQLDKRGWRISFPYTNDSTEDEIENILKKYQFTIKDYRNNLAIDIRSDKEIALNKALTIISKKEPDAKELLDRYASIKSRGIIDKDDDLIIIFSSAKYDIVGMSTGRMPSWSSCMNVIKGGNQSYVEKDIKEGTIICYLTESSDTNIEEPLGRVLIKPFLNIENEKDVILYPDQKTYGNIPNSEKFTDIIDDYMEKTQKLSGTYKRLGCLYDDSYRNEIEGKETIRTRALKKLEKGEKITDPEFMSLPLINKRQFIDNIIDNANRLDPTVYSFASQSQKKKYITRLIQYKRIDDLEDYITIDAPKDMRTIIIDYKINLGVHIGSEEIKYATQEQKEKYIDVRLHYKLSENELEIATPEQREKYIDIELKNITNHIYDYVMKFATHKQMQKYVDWKLRNGYQIYNNEFEIATQEQKERYINSQLRTIDALLTDYELKSATEEQKESYFERKLTIFEKLINTLLIDGTPKDSIKSVTFRYDIQGYELKYLSPVQKKRYMKIISKFI